MNRKQLLFSMICLALTIDGYNQNYKTADSYVKAYPAKQFVLKPSFGNQREFVMHVLFTGDSIATGVKYPVLYITDAWIAFDLFNAIGHLLFKRNEIEPIFLVGISFRANDSSWQKMRDIDFLPNLEKPDSVSGAHQFLRFIKNDLIPYVEKAFPADNSDRGIFGYSSGGAFATWVMKEEPHLFKRIGIGSPPLSYKNYLLLKDNQLLNNISTAKNKVVFVSYGSLESERTITASNMLFDLLNKNGDIQVRKFVFENETHGSSFPASCTKALSYLYKKQK